MSSIDLEKLYAEFCDCYKNCFPEKSLKQVYKEANNEWRSVKSESKNDKLVIANKIGIRVKELESKITLRKTNSLLTYIQSVS